MDLSDFYPYAVAVGAILLLAPTISFVMGKMKSGQVFGVTIILIGFILMTTPFWSTLAVEVGASGWKLEMQKKVINEQSQQIEVLSETLASKASTDAQKALISRVKEHDAKIKSAVIAVDRATAIKRLESAPKIEARELMKAFE